MFAILGRRAHHIRMAIMLPSMSALAAAILVVVIFVAAVWMPEMASPIASISVPCMLCAIGALIYGVLASNQSLTALKLEPIADESSSIPRIGVRR